MKPLLTLAHRLVSNEAQQDQGIRVSSLLKRGTSLPSRGRRERSSHHFIGHGLLLLTLLCVASPAGAQPVAKAPAPSAGGDPAPVTPGAPAAGDRPAPNRPPHGRAAPLEDSSVPSSRVAPKTALVELRDAEDRPIPGMDVELWRVLSGHDETARHRESVARTDGEGKASLGGIESGRGLAYDVRVPSGPAVFASGLFEPASDRGQAIALHVYPAAVDVDQTEVALRTLAYVAPTDEAFQWEVMVTLFNLGRVAWVSQATRFGLPEDATGIESERATPTLDWVPEQHGVRLVGTVPPGRHELVLRFRVKSRHQSQASFRFTLPSRVAEAQVIAEGQAGTRLEVADAAPAQTQSGPKGQRLMVVTRQADRDSPPITDLFVTLSGIPTPGSERWIAVLFAAAILGWGIWPSRTQKSGASSLSANDARQTRDAVLDELVALERARKVEQVGPSTYELARGRLLRALAALGTGGSEPPRPNRGSPSTQRWRKRRDRKRPNSSP